VAHTWRSTRTNQNPVDRRKRPRLERSSRRGKRVRGLYRSVSAIVGEKEITGTKGQQGDQRGYQSAGLETRLGGDWLLWNHVNRRDKGVFRFKGKRERKDFTAKTFYQKRVNRSSSAPIRGTSG